MLIFEWSQICHLYHHDILLCLLADYWLLIMLIVSFSTLLVTCCYFKGTNISTISMIRVSVVTPIQAVSSQVLALLYYPPRMFNNIIHVRLCDLYKSMKWIHGYNTDFHSVIQLGYGHIAECTIISNDVAHVWLKQ